MAGSQLLHIHEVLPDEGLIRRAMGSSPLISVNLQRTSLALLPVMCKNTRQQQAVIDGTFREGHAMTIGIRVGLRPIAAAVGGLAALLIGSGGAAALV